MKLEEQIGRGRLNEVYKSGDKAVKVFAKGYRKADVMNEAYIMSRMEEIEGIRVPKLYDVELINGQYAITMEYIEGKTLAQLMKEEPEKEDAYLQMMMDLQMEIHKCRCMYLEKQKDKMKRKIKDSGLEETQQYEILAALDSAPRHKKLCHGDFTPHNIIVTPKGETYVVDWNHATQGNASADIARTYMWLCLHHPELAEKYVALFGKATGTTREYFEKWLPIFAAARLEKKRENEAELLKKWVDITVFE